jgi:hypothetical protein
MGAGLYRLIRDDDALQLDFMTAIHGVRSFNGLRRRALEALKRETDLALRLQIRRLLALPPDRRTNFLRKKIGLRGLVRSRPRFRQLQAAGPNISVADRFMVIL